MKRFRFLAAVLTAASLLAATNFAALADPKDSEKKSSKVMKAKMHKNRSGKDLLGDKIKRNGNHKLEDHDKFSASVDVSNGKVRGVKVRHADKGDVPVTKYKTTKNMAEGPRDGNGIYLAQYEVVATLWIGYAFIDDYGVEIIYWFPVYMIIDGDAGAIFYYES